MRIAENIPEMGDCSCLFQILKKGKILPSAHLRIIDMAAPHARLAMMCILFITALLPIGCTAKTGSAEIDSDPVRSFHRQLDERKFFQAYVTYTKILPELQKMDEQAAGFEYQRLLASTVGVGQADWVQILESPAIPLDYKLDLVREIDEECHR